MPARSAEPDKYIWCYITKFVCTFDALPAAKRRYQEVVDRVRRSYNVLLTAEQAYNLGQTEPLFSLLIEEIVGFGEPLSESEKDNYSVFIFTTIIEVPEMTGDTVADVAVMLELHDDTDFPAVFPSRTRSIIMSETGYETTGCISQ